MKLSFITFTRNSAKRITGLLENVKDIVDEIIVVDGFSSDATVEIAKSYGAKVYKRRHWGYVEPDRMFALRMASYEWILYLDDDERLGKRLKINLRNLIENAGKMSAFSITRIELLFNKSLLGLYTPNRKIRVFRKSEVIYKGLIHEEPIVRGPVYDLPEEYRIIHLLQSRLYYPIRKLCRYARLEALQYYQRKTKSTLRKSLWRLAPISALLIYLYNIGLLIESKKSLNIPVLISTLSLALYEIYVVTLMKLRSKEETERAKLIEREGIIQLLRL